jgi:PilZ domain
MNAKLASGRMEKRCAMAVPVHIKSLDRTQRVETGVTQNVSLFGARILVENGWGTGERITLQLPSRADPWAARVIYSQELGNGGIAIGVHLEKACPNWAGRNGRNG